MTITSAMAAGCLGALFALSMPARAAPVTYAFTGTITGFSNAPSDFDGIAPGDVFSGQFVYDAAAPGDGAGGYDAISHMEATVHGITLSSPTTSGARDVVITDASTDAITITTYPGYYTDALANMSGQAVCGGTCSPYFLYLELKDSTGTAFGDTSLPTTISLQSFDQSSFNLAWLTPSLSQINTLGTLTSLSVVPTVPEPSMALLMVGGLGVAVASGVRRRRR